MFTTRNMEKLTELLRDFYALTGLRAALFDESGSEALASPETLPAFCAAVQREPGGRQNCFLCHRNACIEAGRRGAQFSCRCHAGLHQAALPIETGGPAQACLLLDPVLLEEDRAGILAYAQKTGAQDLAEEGRRWPAAPPEKLEAAVRLLASAVSYACISGIASLDPDSLSAQLNAYVAENLSEDLSSMALCRRFGVSRTTLYHVSTELYGCGIAEQITRLRVQKAAALLTRTEMSNSEISGAIGIHDYNYFSKVFKKETGLSPRQYRQISRRGAAGAEG